MVAVDVATIQANGDVTRRLCLLGRSITSVPAEKSDRGFYFDHPTANETALMTDTMQQETAAWLYGGSNDLFPNLPWETRPNMTGSEASEDLQRAWVATIMAIQDTLGAVKNGNCFLINMTAGPLVEHVLGEPVSPVRWIRGVCGANWAVRVRHALASREVGSVDRRYRRRAIGGTRSASALISIVRATSSRGSSIGSNIRRIELATTNSRRITWLSCSWRQSTFGSVLYECTT